MLLTLRHLEILAEDPALPFADRVDQCPIVRLEWLPGALLEAFSAAKPVATEAYSL